MSARTLPACRPRQSETLPREWLSAMRAGQLQGLTPRPGLSIDWHRAYTAWCRERGVVANPCTQFVNALTRADLASTRKERFFAGDARISQHAVLFFGDQLAPRGVDRRAWLGSLLAETALMIKRFEARA